MTETTEPASELDRVTKRIATMVEEHFNRGEERFYLSGLGSLLGDDRAVLEKQSKRKLADFVENVMGYELGRTGQHQNILHIVRPAEKGPATVSAQARPLKFVHEIWNAFSTPLATGERRFFDLATRTVSPAPASAGAREIPPALVSDGTLSAPQIADNIQEWVKQEGLDLALFISTRARRKEEGPTLLHQLMDALDGDQLKRTTLPLDVIKTLSERRGA